MIQLYHCMNARSFRPLWTLEELGLAYQLTVLPFPPRMFAKDYLAINPLGTIPYLIDGDVTMSESCGICHYLATRYGPSPLAVEMDDADYARWLNWQYFADATLTFPQTIYLRYSRLEPESRRLPQAAEDYKKWFLGRLRGLELTLTDRQWLAADRFTTADISVGYGLMLADILGISREFGPGVTAYWSRLQERPSFISAMNAQKKTSKEQNVAAGVSL